MNAVENIRQAVLQSDRACGEALVSEGWLRGDLEDEGYHTGIRGGQVQAERAAAALGYQVGWICGAGECGLKRVSERGGSEVDRELESRHTAPRGGP